LFEDAAAAGVETATGALGGGDELPHARTKSGRSRRERIDG
jgi:hypothetical protein